MDGWVGIMVGRQASVRDGGGDGGNADRGPVPRGWSSGAC
jgi:hypothetical protein